MQLTGKDRPANKLTLKMVNALILIMRKIGYRGPFLMRQNNMKSAYNLANTVILSQAIKYAESALKQCTICLEHISKHNMFSHSKCSHRYCYSCMNKHVEAKLFQGQLPDCPHEYCTSQLDIKDCKNFLKQNLYDIMSARITEASIPPTERVYCPFVKCSVLMSKNELQYAASTSFSEFGKRKCSKCRGVFCMNCKVPWHDGYKCSDYVKCFPGRFVDEVNLKSLAARNSWRQCVKCMHMIELATGCNHISCRYCILHLVVLTLEYCNFIR
ncbi:E3 ubiquitin-protein ligase RSL1-like [Bidens hawaiensis]|uniref:E3 ubiquitin-protein ligase RSL1-like n=1 Tax=Bidens hawaiensis TaxID=980011 RepID=UPI00404A53E0